jgi:Fe-S-cluster containining protein
MTAAEQLQAIYAELPKMECKRKCQESCGPLLIPRIEYVQIEKTGAVFNLSSIDAVQLDRRWQWMPKKKLVATAPMPGTLNCSMLYPSGKCRVYEHRPFVCRTWGMIDDPNMRCPFGCKPEKWMTVKEAQAMMRRILEV